MNNYNYNKEIRIILSQVLNAFDGIILKRYSNDPNYTNTPVDDIKTNIVYSPKSRVLFDMVNKNQHFKIPILAMSITGLSHDKDRLFNKNQSTFTSPDLSGNVGPHFQPVPIKISMDTSFLCKFQNDADQYISCVMANLNPYIILSYKNPVSDTIEVRVKIEKSGPINLAYPREDLEASSPYRLSVDFPITCSAWIFRTVQNPVGYIHRIPMSWTHVDRLSDDFDEMHLLENTESTDRLTYVSGLSSDFQGDYVEFP